MKPSKFFKVLIFIFITIGLKSQDIWTPTSGPKGLEAQDLIKTVDNRLVLSATQSGIFISNDQGNSWRKVYKGLKEVNDYADNLTSAPDSTIYAVVRRISGMVETELYRLDYGSDEWIKLQDHLSGHAQIVATESGYVFLVGLARATIAYSLNKGMSFDSILYDPNTSISEFSINGFDENYFSVEEGMSHAIYKINDNGSNLTNLYHGDVSRLLWHPNGYLLMNNLNYDSYRITPQNKIEKIDLPKPFVGVWFITPDFKILATTSGGDYVSSDYGTSWTPSNTNFYKRFWNSNFIYLKDTIIFRSGSCHGSELAKTADSGTSWISLDDKFENPNDNTIFFDKSDNLFSQTCWNRFSMSKDHGANWNSLNLPLPEDASINELVSNYNGNLFLRNRFSLFKSIDKGMNWIETMHFGNSEFRKLAGDGDKTIYLFGQKTSFISKDGGENWSLISTPPVQEVDQVYFRSDGSVYILDQNPSAPLIYYTIDAGQSWTKANNGFFNLITLFFANNGTIYLSGYIPGSPYGLYTSDDNLKTIKFVAEKTFNSIVIDDQDVIYGLVNGGTCERSKNGGLDWELFSSGLPKNKIVSLALDKKQYLYAGLENERVYKTIEPVALPSGSVEANKLNEVIVYPNPATNRISIKIPESIFKMQTSWTLSDLTGRIVKSEKMNTKQFSFSTGGIQNGIYFLKINQMGIPVSKIVLQH